MSLSDNIIKTKHMSPDKVSQSVMAFPDVCQEIWRESREVSYYVAVVNTPLWDSSVMVWAVVNTSLWDSIIMVLFQDFTVAYVYELKCGYTSVQTSVTLLLTLFWISSLINQKN
jgi:uncharacterized membrane protein